MNKLITVVFLLSLSTSFGAMEKIICSEVGTDLEIFIQIGHENDQYHYISMSQPSEKWSLADWNCELSQADGQTSITTSNYTKTTYTISLPEKISSEKSFESTLEILREDNFASILNLNCRTL